MQILLLDPLQQGLNVQDVSRQLRWEKTMPLDSETG